MPDSTLVMSSTQPVMPDPDRASLSLPPLLYVQKIGPTVQSNCTYRCHFALSGHFRELYVQKIALTLHFTCTYRLVREESDLPSTCSGKKKPLFCPATCWESGPSTD